MLIDLFTGPTMLSLLVEAMLALKHALLLLDLVHALRWSRPRWKTSVFARAIPVSVELERER